MGEHEIGVVFVYVHVFVYLDNALNDEATSVILVVLSTKRLK